VLIGARCSSTWDWPLLAFDRTSGGFLQPQARLLDAKAWRSPSPLSRLPGHLWGTALRHNREWRRHGLERSKNGPFEGTVKLCQT
jgi:hypothetical protein